MRRKTWDVQEMYMYVIAGSKTLILYLRNCKIPGRCYDRIHSCEGRSHVGDTTREDSFTEHSNLCCDTICGKLL